MYGACHVVLLGVTLAVGVSQLAAQDKEGPLPSDGIPQDAPQVSARVLEFDPPKPVVVRQTNRTSARGALLSISEEGIKLRTLSGKEVFLEIDEVRSVKSTDGTLEWLPRTESFAELAGRLSHKGASLAGTGDPDRSPGGNDPAARQFQSAQAKRRPEIDSKERAAAPGKREAPPDTPDDSQPAPAETDAPAKTANDAPRFVLLCSNCNQELPATIRSGDKCPHCGTVVVYDDSPSPAFADSGSSDGGYPTAPGFPTPPADSSAATGHSATPATSSNVTTGNPLADMSMTLKVGVFLGVLLLGYLLLMRR